jgi:hypothetical protein
MSGSASSFGRMTIGLPAEAGCRTSRGRCAEKAANEHAATEERSATCAKRDANCRVIAIGPFTVAPNVCVMKLGSIVPIVMAGLVPVIHVS